MNRQLKSQIVDYSKKNVLIAEHFSTPKCVKCHGDTFTVVMNENEGVAARLCTSCDGKHGIADNANLIDDVEAVYPIECTCGANEFKIMVGVALNKKNEHVRWLYLGCECVDCGLSGVYGDWKCEFDGYQTLLNNV